MDYQKYINQYKKSITDKNELDFEKFLNEDLVPIFYFLAKSNSSYGLTFESFTSNMLEKSLNKYPFLKEDDSFNEAITLSYLKESKLSEFEKVMPSFASNYSPEGLKDKFQYLITYLNSDALSALHKYLPRYTISQFVNILSRSFSENKNMCSIEKIKALTRHTDFKAINYEQIHDVVALAVRFNSIEGLDFFKSHFSKFLEKKTRQGNDFVIGINEEIKITNWDHLMSGFYVEQGHFENNFDKTFWDREINPKKLKLCISPSSFARRHKFKPLNLKIKAIEGLVEHEMNFNRYFSNKYWSVPLFNILMNSTKMSEPTLKDLSIDDIKILHSIHSVLQSMRELNSKETLDETLLPQLESKVEKYILELNMALDLDNLPNKSRKMKI